MAEKLSGFTLEELFTNRKKESEGVWVDFFGGSKLKVASVDSPEYKAKLARLAKQHKLQLDSDNDDSIELVQDITAEAYAECVLLDWKGINMNGQEDVKYTKELGKEALLRSSKFRSFVEEAASEHMNFKDDVQKAAEVVKKQ